MRFFFLKICNVLVVYKELYLLSIASTMATPFRPLGLVEIVLNRFLVYSTLTEKPSNKIPAVAKIFPLKAKEVFGVLEPFPRVYTLSGGIFSTVPWWRWRRTAQPQPGHQLGQLQDRHRNFLHSHDNPEK